MVIRTRRAWYIRRRGDPAAPESRKDRLRKCVNPSTQARDIQLMDEAYSVVKMQAVDMFPIPPMWKMLPCWCAGANLAGMYPRTLFCAFLLSMSLSAATPRLLPGQDTDPEQQQLEWCFIYSNSLGYNIDYINNPRL